MQVLKKILSKKKIDFSNPNSKNLTEDEKKQVKEMKQTDQEVKTHEHAHQSAAAGINASAASYDTEKGPDGKSYAVAGEVELSFTPTSDPQQNIRMAEAMRRAALAPAEPSSQDKKVAQHANQLINQYQREAQEQRSQEIKDNIENSKDAKSNDVDKDSDISSEDKASKIFAGNKDLNLPEAPKSSVSNSSDIFSEAKSAKEDLDKMLAKLSDSAANIVDMQEYKNSLKEMNDSNLANSDAYSISQSKPSVKSSQVSGLSKETVAFIEKQKAASEDESSGQPDVTLV